jgi:heptaprenyl diphosphate synthase
VDSVNARWGNLVAIVAGDFLLARSAGIAASLGTEVAGLIADTLAELCQGQVAEVRSAYRKDRTSADYLTAIAGKTAALMAASCRIGAITAGADRPMIEALTTFGRCFGMVFQLHDDVLDIVGSEEELGKPAGQDLAEGIYTLPVLYALADPDIGPELGNLLGQPLDQSQRDQARAAVAASSAIPKTIAMGRQWAADAAAAAAATETPELATALSDLTTSLLDVLPAVQY